MNADRKIHDNTRWTLTPKGAALADFAAKSNLPIEAVQRLVDNGVLVVRDDNAVCAPVLNTPEPITE